MFVHELEIKWGRTVECKIGHKNLTSAEDCIEMVCGAFGPLVNEPKEHFYVLALDIRNKVSGWQEVSKGSISASVVDPADIMRFAIMASASRVILVHNHPSGECEPSKEDIDTTGKIVAALKYVGIRVLDHIILDGSGDINKYYSFSRAGMV
jgi:DNA repair protein RadC